MELAERKCRLHSEKGICTACHKGGQFVVLCVHFHNSLINISNSLHTILQQHNVVAKKACFLLKLWLVPWDQNTPIVRFNFDSQVPTKSRSVSSTVSLSSGQVDGHVANKNVQMSGRVAPSCTSYVCYTPFLVLVTLIIQGFYT